VSGFADEGRSDVPYLRTESGQRLELMPNRVYVLGRGDLCDLRVDDEACSRRHAKVSVAGDPRIVHVADLGSKNGTFVNEERLTEPRQVETGDRIQIGTTVYVVGLPAGREFDLDTRTTVFKK